MSTGKVKYQKSHLDQKQDQLVIEWSHQDDLDSSNESNLYSSVLKYLNESNYIQLKNPTLEERFSFQKYTFLKKDEDESKGIKNENYGFRVYDKNINYRKWSKNKDFCESAYKWSEEGVFCRGVHFKTGDILLTNQNSDSDGLFSTFLERKINFSHAAVYITLLINGKKIPSVVEINEYGVRAVPLKALLSEDFSTYIEVYRSSEIDFTKFETELSHSALEVVNEVHAFDMYQETDQQKYLNCTRTIDLIFKKVGIDIDPSSSKYHLDAKRNLTLLGFGGTLNRVFSMPDDFLYDTRFNLVGTVANGDFLSFLSRNLVRDYIQYIWRNYHLNKESFGLKYKINSSAVKLIQKNNVLSPLILKFIGLKKENFPSGPRESLSLVPYFEKHMKAATKKINHHLQKNWIEYQDLTWKELTQSKTLKKELELSTKGFLKRFDHPLTYSNASRRRRYKALRTLRMHRKYNI